MKQKKSHYFQIGDLAYFHAYAQEDNNTSYFLCQGIITRLPKHNSPVFKIAITAVNPTSLLCGHVPELASNLLGKKIAKEKKDLSGKPTGWTSVMYGKAKWICLSEKETQKIRRNLQQSKKKGK